MTLTTKLGALAAAGVLAGGLAACGGSDPTSAGNANVTVGSGPATDTTTSQAPTPVAKIDRLTGSSTKVTLDASFLKALDSLGVTPGPLGDASISKAGVATFPITGGNVTYYKPGTTSPYVQGSIEHQGSGLSLKAGATTVDLTDFVVDPGASVLSGKVTVDGQTAAPSAPLFFLDGSTLKPLRVNAAGSRAVLEGTTVELKQEAADLLNTTFKITALKGGLGVGVAKITVNTK